MYRTGRKSFSGVTGTPFWAAGAMVALVALGGCASTPPAPTAALEAAEQAIATAEQARVADYASVELSQARDKHAAALVAVRDEDMPLAGRLAAEALMEAQLATARANELKARKVNEDMVKSARTLQQEMDRNTGIPR